MKIGWVLSLFLVLLTWILFGQVQQAMAMLSFFILGLFLTRLITGTDSKNGIAYSLYALFFFVYGTLCIATQFQLIHDPDTDYYIHNDACDAFFPQVMNFAPNEKWSDLFQNTTFNPFFSDFPLSMFFFSVMAKIGIIMEVDNMRFFLRIHEFMLAAIVVAMITDVLERNKIEKNEIYLNVIVFGLCTYLYVGSCIFTRDMHVCFIYSCIFYYMLKPKVRHINIKFFLLFILALGARPENGIFSVVFFGAYYFYNRQGKMNPIWLAVAVLIFIVYVYLMGDVFYEAVDTVSRYQKATASNNTGGFFEKVNSLPFPLSTIGISIYGILMPLPFDLWLVGEGNTFLIFPYVLSPFLISFVFITTLWYILRYFKTDKRFSLILIVAILSFVAINTTSPDVRRSFASIPGLFMGYCLFANRIPRGLKKAIKFIVWPMIFVINLGFFFYVRF